MDGTEQMIASSSVDSSPSQHDRRRRPSWTTCLFLSVLMPLACPTARAGDAEAVTKQRFEFEQPKVIFSREFAGARLHNCFFSDGQYHLLIRPESDPVNNSAWYAFRVRSASAQPIEVRLVYQQGAHRYVPKTSRDGEVWQRLAAEKMRVGRRHAVLKLDVGPEPLWVAAQELITVDDTADWIFELAERPFVESNVIGRSVEDRPIYKLDVGNTDASDSIFILARQHPPEVTGSIGMMHFVETICGDTALARRFRQRYHVVVVPMANPDGVEHGHWRHNARGVDLNRDWESFRQPETRALRDELMELDRDGQLHLFLDFHSTFHDVFYTHADDPRVTPFRFTQKWLAGLGRRFPDYDVRRDVCQDTKTTSRRWVYREFGVPAITYEFGDRAPRPRIRQISRGSAEEMMRLMLMKSEWKKNRMLARESAPAEIAVGK